MKKEKVTEYRERTIKRLVELVNKQSAEGEKASASWMTKKLIEDNKQMVKMLVSNDGGHQVQMQG